MIPATSFDGETVAVMGLARSGRSAVASLLAGGARVLAWDDDAGRRRQAADLGAAVVDLAAADYAGIAALVLSPGIPHTHPLPHPAAARARASGTPVIGDVEVLLRARPGIRTVAVTGTNGKSTTTALVGHIFAAAGRACEVGGNIGRPVLEFAAVAPAGRVCVIELSSYQLELTPSLSCAVAVVLNIAPDHLDRHGGMEGYVAAKRWILESLPSGATAVVGIDDPVSTAMHAALSRRRDVAVVAVSGSKLPTSGVGMDGTAVIQRAGGRRTLLADLALAPGLPGQHNAQNACAAAAAALAQGIDAAAIGVALLTFPGLPHRQERVACCGGITYVNDSKATNAEAAATALACYETIYWIAGGRAKAGGIAGLAPYFSRIRHAFLIGEAAGSFAAALEGQVDYTACGCLTQAVAAADAMARRDGIAGAVVLLSPAAASFDQFKSFEMRGDCFRSLITRLVERAGMLEGDRDD